MDSLQRQGICLPLRNTKSGLISPTAVSAALTLAIKAFAASSSSLSAEYDLSRRAVSNEVRVVWDKQVVRVPNREFDGQSERLTPSKAAQ